MEEPRRRHMLDDLRRNTQPATAWRELPRRHHKNAGGVAIYILPLAATGGRAELARHLSRTVNRHAYPCRKRLVWFALWSPHLATHARHLAAGLLKRHLSEAPELPRMQAFSLLRTQAFEGFQSNLEMLADTLAVEL